LTRREGTKLLTRLLKHFCIGLSAFALMALATSVLSPGEAGTIFAEVAHAGQIASSEVVDRFHLIDAEFGLSEPVYRSTDRGDAILMLALVLSGIVTFNLWLFRHLHRVYAPSRQASGGTSNCR
jgi:hypothetical protein